MAKLTGKYLDGTSKIEKKTFNGPFDGDGYIFDGQKTINCMTTMKKELTNIYNEYKEISELYKKALKCTSTGKKMDTKDGIGKSIKKYADRAKKRLEYINTRKKQLTDTISNIEWTMSYIEAQNKQTMNAGASAVDSADGTDG